MKVVDVLCDDRRHLPDRHHGCDAEMAARRLGVAVEIVHRELSPPRFTPGICAFQEEPEGNWLVAHPRTVRRAEIRHATFRGDSRSGKPRNDAGLPDHL